MPLNGVPISFSECVLKTPLTVAANLRYNDVNGDLVTSLFPNDYTELIGANVSTLKAQYQQVNALLASYNTRITTLEEDVAELQSSGANYMLYITGTCLYNDDQLPHNIDDAVNRLMGNTCSYNSILGTPTALANSVAAMCSGLSTLPAFSQESSMAGLAGWVTTPTTVADSNIDLWKAYCDIRAGVTTALAAVTPSCAQVIVAYQAISNTPLTFQLYFNGYTFIPTGYTDNSSLIKITDTAGNIYQTGFDIVAASTDTDPVTLQTSGSSLSYTSTTYQITVTSKVQNTSLGTTCEKVVITTLENPNYPPIPAGNSECCPDIGNYYNANQTSGTTAITLTSALSYTPRFATWTSKSAFTSAQLVAGGSPPYMSYSLGTVILHIVGGTGVTGAIDIDFMVHR